MYDRVKNKDEIEFKGHKYPLFKEAAILNDKGRALFLYYENNPQPAILKYKNVEWISNESLMNIINNKIIQKLMQVQEDWKENLALLGNIAGLVAAIASVLTAAKVFGIIK